MVTSDRAAWPARWLPTGSPAGAWLLSTPPARAELAPLWLSCEFSPHDARDLRPVRSDADRRRARLLPRSRPGRLHPVRPQRPEPDPAARADRRAARDPRAQAAADLDRPGRRARGANEAARMG